MDQNAYRNPKNHNYNYQAPKFLQQYSKSQFLP